MEFAINVVESCIKEQMKNHGIIKNRLEVYEKTATPVIEFYKSQSVLYHAKAGDGEGKTSMDVVQEVTEYIKR